MCKSIFPIFSLILWKVFFPRISRLTSDDKTSNQSISWIFELFWNGSFLKAAVFKPCLSSLKNNNSSYLSSSTFDACVDSCNIGECILNQNLQCTNLSEFTLKYFTDREQSDACVSSSNCSRGTFANKETMQCISCFQKGFYNGSIFAYSDHSKCDTASILGRSQIYFFLFLVLFQACSKDEVS